MPCKHYVTYTFTLSCIEEGVAKKEPFLVVHESQFDNEDESIDSELPIKGCDWKKSFLVVHDS